MVLQHGTSETRFGLSTLQGYLTFSLLGMPHLHILLILKRSAVLDSPEFVNDYVCAEIPTLPEASDQSEEANQQRRLHQLITTSNLHDCHDDSECRVDGKCSKRFPKRYSDQTILSGM